DNGAGGGSAPAPAPISSDTLYQNALRDFTGGKYDLARQEFSDYLTNFPTNDLASNAQFYLGEIDYAQGNYKVAVGEYVKVINQYPRSFKVAASLLKKAQSEIKLGQKPAGIRDLREVVRKYPGSDEARQAQARLRELGVTTAAR
ncbi:MAG: tol-pal system protein YbgF, partial [Candidatus Acidiferrales bacterium]